MTEEARWTDEDVGILRENWPLGVDACLRSLPLHALVEIVDKARELGLIGLLGVSIGAPKKLSQQGLLRVVHRLPDGVEIDWTRDFMRLFGVELVQRLAANEEDKPCPPDNSGSRSK